MRANFVRYSTSQGTAASRSCHSVQKELAFGSNSPRMRPLNDSIQAFCAGFPGSMKCKSGVTPPAET